MKTAILILLALAVPVLSEDPPAPEPKQPKDMDPLELIKHYGYQGSAQVVETTDGYQLTLYRIPKGRKDTSTAARPAVLLMHGFETSAVDWLLSEQSAAYVFADGGFDVYIGSFRGSTYGRAHKLWSPTTNMFWQFGLDEMAKVDFPALVEAVLKTGNVQNTYVVAHSTGTTATLMALATTNLGLMRKIKQVHAIAPILNTKNMQGPLKFLTPLMKSMTAASALFGVNELKPDPELQRSWSKYVCTNPEKELTCKNAMLMISGAHTNQIDQSRLDVINAHGPGGVSVRTAVHLAQLSGENSYFRAFDFGHPSLNTDHYKSPQPPIYDIKQVNTPTYLYSSECDWISEPLDVENIVVTGLRGENKLVTSTIVPSFNHMDFIWGSRAATEIYNPILVAMAQDFQVPPKNTP